MNEDLYNLIKDHYVNNHDDSISLFKAVLSVAQETGLDDALAYLEECVNEKRKAWLERNNDTIEITGDPLKDGYKLFYERYLGLTIPGDGEIVEENDRRIVYRWWNRCPTLEACQALGFDTREICRKVYHQSVQIMLSSIDSRLRFKRNYHALRPYTPYCEESIEIEEQ